MSCLVLEMGEKPGLLEKKKPIYKSAPPPALYMHTKCVSFTADIKLLGLTEKMYIF